MQGHLHNGGAARASSLKFPRVPTRPPCVPAPKRKPRTSQRDSVLYVPSVAIILARLCASRSPTSGPKTVSTLKLRQAINSPFICANTPTCSQSQWSDVVESAGDRMCRSVPRQLCQRCVVAPSASAQQLCLRFPAEDDISKPEELVSGELLRE